MMKTKESTAISNDRCSSTVERCFYQSHERRKDREILIHSLENHVKCSVSRFEIADRFGRVTHFVDAVNDRHHLVRLDQIFQNCQVIRPSPLLVKSSRV